ncbi:tRNA adenosine(34) deaminase TadA [Candidatus Clavichlamydia salmonicola]|uniref:tRNA adenosine(34) deaminase TadA n=1 Tax=Candidatus Clavichlamydia salmonicola TaxID=469812 RepID=UPI001E484901|nr:tRNA adenosine(34) deaminase TadA [Candidatus Clavichlamydia salmonicola]
MDYSDDTLRDEYFMQAALQEAKKAFDKDEVPVGAVLVKENRIITKGHNQVESLQDSTAHAEILCISAAGSLQDNWRLTDTTLYITLEPCPMCAGAILGARITRVVWGASDSRLGAGGSWLNFFEEQHPFHKIIFQKDILKEECSLLIKNFFKKRRA